MWNKIKITAMFVMIGIATYGQSSISPNEGEENISVTQHSWSEYERVDTCTTKYAVVYDRIGRCGIYDLKKHQNITEIVYSDLVFSRMMELEDGGQSTVFYATKGQIEGIVTVSPSGRIVTMVLPKE